jgi:hypothetical protein
MQRVHRRVCAWLAEDRPPEETVTDGEFAAFLRGVLEEVRATAPNLVAWRYHSIARRPDDSHCHRANTTGDLAEALRQWRQLRQSLGVEGHFNVFEGINSDRDEAEELAQRIMRTLSDDEYPTDSDALDVLRQWGFKHNRSRLNVFPVGSDWVHSDTLGLVIPQGKAEPDLSQATLGHETVFRLLHRWIRGRFANSQCGVEPAFTSMSVNKGYAARLHRDARNEGPSIALAAGAFTGGGLKYWPSDDGHMDLETLRPTPHVLLDTRGMPRVFDGNLGHEVEHFTGERFSVILFTCPKRDKMSGSTRRRLADLGVTVPTDAALLRLRAHVPAAEDSGSAVSDSGGKLATVPGAASRPRSKRRAAPVAGKKRAAARRQGSTAARSVKLKPKPKLQAWPAAKKAAAELGPGKSKEEQTRIAKRIYVKLKGGMLPAAAKRIVGQRL